MVGTGSDNKLGTVQRVRKEVSERGFGKRSRVRMRTGGVRVCTYGCGHDRTYVSAYGCAYGHGESPCT